jgi:hypothetical protein
MKTSYKWHDGCYLVLSSINKDGVYAYWCKEHAQWTYVFPSAITYHYPEETKLPSRYQEL